MFRLAGSGKRSRGACANVRGDPTEGLTMPHDSPAWPDLSKEMFRFDGPEEAVLEGRWDPPAVSQAP